MFRRNVLRALGVLVASAVVFACEDSAASTGPKNFPASATIPFSAFNSGTDNIHFYMEGGDRTNSNRVVPGQHGNFHTTPFTWETESDFVNVKFEASNNLGEIGFGSIAFTGKQLKEGRTIKVTWTGTPPLTVQLQ